MKYILDTNVIIRFLANDHPVHSPAAFRLFEQASHGTITLILDHVIIAECVYVLSGKYYQVSREEIFRLLEKIIDFAEVQSENKIVMISALHHYAALNVDYPDAYLASLAEMKRISVASFNKKDFNRMGINNYQPS
jgi:predicted nucleic-acid-binding protein